MSQRMIAGGEICKQIEIVGPVDRTVERGERERGGMV